jgi:hypothetical protein
MGGYFLIDKVTVNDFINKINLITSICIEIIPLDTRIALLQQYVLTLSYYDRKSSSKE